MRIENSSSRGSSVPSATNVSFPPRATIHCIGPAFFRSRGARDLACLLDLDLEVEAWECVPLELRSGDLRHTPDFRIYNTSGRSCLLDASDGAESWVAEAAQTAGCAYECVTRERREQGWRLRNARDLLRYGNYRCPLGDRIRIMATLDEIGSFTIAEGLPLFREVTPIAGLASLVLQRMVSVDLDEALIGPETVVRRIGL